MRKILLMSALVFAFAGSLAPNRADAMTNTTPAAVQHAINGNGAVEQVRYDCQRVWRCNWRGCGWRRECDWEPRYRYRQSYRHQPYRYIPPGVDPRYYPPARNYPSSER